MKYFASLLLTLICSAGLFAQTPPPVPLALSTPYGETPEAWQNFAPKTENFALEVPGIMSPGFALPDNAPIVPSDSETRVPLASPTPAASPVAVPKSRSYLTLVGGDYYYIFSDPVSDPYLNKMIYAFAESQAPGIEPNRIYGFTDVFGYHHKILIVKSGARVYTFQTVSAAKNSPADRFFDGIRIRGMKLQAERIDALQNIPAENAALSVACNPPLPPPPSASVPPANGIGSSSSEPTSTVPPPPAPTTPIRIISKPRPNYTDLARFYQTTGTVALRVTFRADGKIAAVSFIKRLPFGLALQSVGAVCRVQFEPATRNGVPYTVTKQVQYNFTLY